MLTVSKLENMTEGEVFATGLTIDNYTGVNMNNSDRILRWVAVRGHGFHDWAIYIDTDDHSEAEVKRFGDKVTEKDDIRKLVPCDDEAMNLYRR